MRHVGHLRGIITWCIVNKMYKIKRVRRER
jgi:hypothetical protein